MHPVIAIPTIFGNLDFRTALFFVGLGMLSMSALMLIANAIKTRLWIKKQAPQANEDMKAAAPQNSLAKFGLQAVAKGIKTWFPAKGVGRVNRDKIKIDPTQGLLIKIQQGGQHEDSGYITNDSDISSPNAPECDQDTKKSPDCEKDAKQSSESEEEEDLDDIKDSNYDLRRALKLCDQVATPRRTPKTEEDFEVFASFASASQKREAAVGKMG